MMGVPEARSRFREEWDIFRGRIEQLLQEQSKVQEELLSQISQHSCTAALDDGMATGVALHWAPKKPSASFIAAPPVARSREPSRLLTLRGHLAESCQMCEEPALGGQRKCSPDARVGDAALCSRKLRELAKNIASMDGASSDPGDVEREHPDACATCHSAIVRNCPEALAQSPRYRASSVEDSLMALSAAVKEVDVKVSALGADAAVGRFQGTGGGSSHKGSLAPLPAISEGGGCHTEQIAENVLPPVDGPARAHVAPLMEVWGGNMKSHSWWQQSLISPAAAAALWWQRLEAPTPRGRFAACVLSRQFDTLVLVVILANACVTWYALDYEASHLGQDSHELHALEFSFLAFYIVELALKISVHRHGFFFNKDMCFNWFDLFLVVSSLARAILLELTDVRSNSNITFVRSLRLLKLASLLRGLRVIQQLNELRTMVISLLGSVQALMWGMILLVLILYIFGSVFAQGAVVALTATAPSLSDEEREKVSQVFGSVETAMFTLYSSCFGGDDWSNFYRAASTIGAPYAALFVVFIAFSQIAVLNILTAIFLNKAMEAAKPDKIAAGIEQRKLDLAAYEEVCALGQELDIRRDGFIRVEDFDRELQHGSLGAHLALLGLHVTDSGYFFRLVSASDEAAGVDPHEISVDEFIDGCLRMRGAASAIDFCCMEKHMRLILQNLRQHREETWLAPRGLFRHRSRRPLRGRRGFA